MVWICIKAHLGFIYILKYNKIHGAYIIQVYNPYTIAHAGSIKTISLID